MRIVVNEMPAYKDECIFSDLYWDEHTWKNCCTLDSDGCSKCDLENGECSYLCAFRSELATAIPYEIVKGRKRRTSDMDVMCVDNRFEIIASAKKDLLEGTNIDTCPDEMAVIDNILFRCWQMGWLDRYDRKED